MSRLINSIVSLATDTAFRSVEVRRESPEPRGAVLVVANHGGGLGDILTVIAGSKRFPRFLARDIIWKFPIAKQIMNAVRAIPVSRRQDHGNSADNTSMFAAAYEGLAEGDLLAIYPEGESIPEPRLAPLRTGAARILLGAWAQGTDTTILPMGLHYFDISVLRGRALVLIGAPLQMSGIVGSLPAEDPLDEHNQPAVHALTQIIGDHLSEVVAEYSDWQTRRLLESAAAIYLIGLPDTDSVTYSDITTTADRIGRASSEEQQEVITNLKAYQSAIELLGIKDDEIPDVAMTGVKVAGKAAEIASLTPFAVYGTVVNGLPMAGLRLISLSGVAPATAASLKPAFAMLAFPAMWATLGWWGYKRAGIPGAVAMASTGPLSLGATVRVAEQGQLAWRLTRAYRRAKGQPIEQLTSSQASLRESVARALGEPFQPGSFRSPIASAIAAAHG
jgi:glycerol-3-phosphate O-acyltransferase / dihydroxyacetone phosphate acyltransferase